MKILYTFLLITYFCLSCDKTPIVVKDNKYYLTNTVWKNVSIIDGNVEIIQLCDMDNEYIFDTNNVVTVSYLGLKCDTFEPTSLKQIYSLNFDQKLIQIVNNGASTNTMQLTVDSTSLVLHNPNLGGQAYTMKFIKK